MIKIQYFNNNNNNNNNNDDDDDDDDDDNSVAFIKSFKSRTIQRLCIVIPK